MVGHWCVGGHFGGLVIWVSSLCKVCSDQFGIYKTPNYHRIKQDKLGLSSAKLMINLSYLKSSFDNLTAGWVANSDYIARLS